MLWPLSLAVLGFGMTFAFVSYFYQKSFSTLNKTSTILVTSLAFTLISVFLLFVMFYVDISSIQSHTFKGPINFPSTVLTIVNVVFYIVIPFLYFYFQNTSNSNSTQEEYSHLTVFQHYFYYSVLYFCLNIMYLVYYRVFSNTQSSKLIRDMFIPEVLKKYSYLATDFEVLTYINFSILIAIGKLFAIGYATYGGGKMVSTLIDSLRKTEEIKEEFNSLNNNMNKNSETIRMITTKKLMTGKQLTKEEKNLLKSCKENTTIFQHKQDILEEKYPKVQIFLSYLSIPFKFLLIISCLVLNFLIVFSMSVVIFNKIFHNMCGASYCGYLTQRINKMSFSFENILFDFSRNNHKILQLIVVASIVVFKLGSLLIGMKFRGISLGYQFYSFNDLKSNNTVNFLFYSLFFLLSLTILYDFNYLIPDYAYFYNLPDKCNFLRIDVPDCGISSMGLYYIRLSLNFSGFIYYDLTLTTVSIILSAFFMVYLPIKSTYQLFKRADETESRQVPEALTA